MLIQQFRVSGLLSFGPRGIDLAMRPLNVLIGPNGSGKSNFIEVLSLLRAASNGLPEPMRSGGGVREWFWQGPSGTSHASVEVVLDNPNGKLPLRHRMELVQNGNRLEVIDEAIENQSAYEGKKEPYFFYRYQRGNPVLLDFSESRRELRRETIRPDESILSQVRDPVSYPVLHWLQVTYEGIRLYRNWTFGTTSPIRRAQSTQSRSDVLDDGGENLAMVLNRIRMTARRELSDDLRKLIEGVEDFQVELDGGNVHLVLEESVGSRPIPASRLSDGTLRYLYLLAVLRQPNPPSLIVIEEPELGLHPDLLTTIAGLLVDASKRTQLVVTTHSRELVDALNDDCESIVVCGRNNGESTFKRLDADRMKLWLKKYSLGELWASGEIEGNRW